MPRRLGGRSVQGRGREGKNGKHGRRELGARSARRWPVASLHHPLPGLGSRAHLCQAESPDILSVIVKGPSKTGLREAADIADHSDGTNTGQSTFSTVGNRVGLHPHGRPFTPHGPGDARRTNPARLPGQRNTVRDGDAARVHQGPL